MRIDALEVPADLGPIAPHVGAEPEVLLHREPTNVPRPSGTWAMPSRAMSSLARPSIRWPSNRTVPTGGTMPDTARSVVVFPAPLAPRMS